MSDRTQATPHDYVPPAGDAAVDPLPPALVDGKRYRLLRKLGGGGMGVVYLLHNVGMDRPEVVKLVAPDKSASPEMIDRFRQEIAAIGRLSHPNVAVGHGTEEIDGTLLLVLEYVDGTDLDALVKQSGPLPVGRACEYVRQAALGLAHAHGRGIVHRDVKPANLLLWREREQELVKVIDFGLAKAPALQHLRRDAGTTYEQQLGTPAYMAPEQWAEASSAGTPADVYALGCTLYHLLAGRPPFAGCDTRKALMVAHATEPPPPLAGLLPGLDSVLNRMLAKDPADRPESASEVAALLAPFTGIPDRLGSAPPPAGGGATITHDPRAPDTRPEPIGKTTVDYRSPWKRPALAVGAAVGGLAAVWVAVAAFGGKPAGTAAPPPTGPEKPLASAPDKPAVTKPAATTPTKPPDPPKVTPPKPPEPKPVRPVVSEFGRNDIDGWQTALPLGGSKDVTGPIRLEKSGSDWWIAATREPMRQPFFWAAPDKFLGDQSAQFGRWLGFRVRASQPVSPKEILDAQYVTLRRGIGPGATVLFVLGRDLKPVALPGGWRGYAVRLDHTGHWRVKADRGPGGFDGPPATDEQVKAVLGRLTALLIRGEYTAEDKDGALDSVVFGAADRPKW